MSGDQAVVWCLHELAHDGEEHLCSLRFDARCQNIFAAPIPDKVNVKSMTDVPMRTPFPIGMPRALHAQLAPGAVLFLPMPNAEIGKQVSALSDGIAETDSATLIRAH